MSEKIYEFSLLDKYNMAESDILRMAEQSLVAEADLQGWEQGYTYQQLGSPKSGENGVVEYKFAVFGKFSENINDSSDKNSSVELGAEKSVAARPVEA